MKNIFITTILVLVFSLSALEFFREDLDFVLSEAQFEVSGTYFFRNETDREIKRILFYPFPADSSYGEITTFSAICVIDSADVSKGFSDKGANFIVNLKPGESKGYFLSYKQKIYGNKAEYILTTTKAWGKPFEEVNYTLAIPKEILLDSLSYFPDSLTTFDDSYKLFYHKTIFMPDRNFQIFFKQ
jgi:hypothetical protein